MKKGKLPIIICLALILSLAGYLIFSKDKLDSLTRHVNSDKGLASASTDVISDIHKDNSNNNTYLPTSPEYDDNNNNKEEDQMSTKDPNNQWTPATEMDLDPSSPTVYVNKEYCLPQDYVPDNLVTPKIYFDLPGNSERKLMREDAAKAIESLFNAALEDGHTLYGVSGYRSYKRQKEIFLNNIVNKGKIHTLSYSAAPGTSEHQTGLAMDVSVKSIRYRLITAFANCPEGKWLAENAHHYGFIIRYPKDKSHITGYAYEPWHIRYVGKDLATYLYNNGLTLDEYYNYVPSDDFNYEEKYASLINYVPPATPTPTPTPPPVIGLDLDGDDILDVFVGDDLDGDGIPDIVLGDLLDEDGIPQAMFREGFDHESFFGYTDDSDEEDLEDDYDQADDTTDYDEEDDSSDDYYDEEDTTNDDLEDDDYDPYDPNIDSDEDHGSDDNYDEVDTPDKTPTDIYDDNLDEDLDPSIPSDNQEDDYLN